MLEYIYPYKGFFVSIVYPVRKRENKFTQMDGLINLFINAVHRDPKHGERNK
jgi:hypothetical protein